MIVQFNCNWPLDSDMLSSYSVPSDTIIINVTSRYVVKQIFRSGIFPGDRNNITTHPRDVLTLFKFLASSTTLFHVFWQPVLDEFTVPKHSVFIRASTFISSRDI